MYKSYFKTAWRNLLRSKGYSIISIGGLAVGMTVGILIGLWIYDELSFNKYFKNYERIAQVMQHDFKDGKTLTDGSMPLALGSEIRSSFLSHFEFVVMSSQPAEYIISTVDKKFVQSGLYMQSDGPEMLTLKMLYGDHSGLKDLNSIFLSESLAKKLFGNDDPTGQPIKINNNQDVVITGVYEDFPDNSDFNNVTFIAPWELYISANEWVRNIQDDWDSHFIFIYVQVPANTDFGKVSALIRNVKSKHIGSDDASDKPVLFLHPMSKWHLSSEFDENGLAVTSEQKKFIWFYGIIGIFVLLLACINFMNLSTARAEKRVREVGIRKVIGSRRIQLVNLFFGESVLVALFAFLLSIVLVQLILPWFNEVAEKDIVILWNDPWFWLAGGGFTLATGLLAGSYPAIYLSSFKPIQALKGTFHAGRPAVVHRKVLIVFQFTVSMVLIIGTIIVYKQIGFAKSRSVGYLRDGLLMVQMTSADFKGKYDVLRNELKNSGAVQEIAQSASTVTGVWSYNDGFSLDGKNSVTNENFATLAVSYEYGKTVGWEIIAGRDFSREYASDSSALVINEAAAEYLGLKNPVGTTIHWDVSWENSLYRSGDYTIVGVVKNMVMRSPYKPSDPTFFFLPGPMNWILVRIHPNADVHDALSKIEAVFNKLIPSVPFEYKFANEEYSAKFSAEERVGKLAGFFAVLAIIISCLGVLGMAAFVAEQRTKEIAIRKVLGASVASVWRMLSKDFLVLVLLSFLFAIPVSYYFLDAWLQQYEYRTNMTWWIFAVAGMGSFVITLLTVSYQAVKAGLTNPVKSLRSE